MSFLKRIYIIALVGLIGIQLHAQSVDSLSLKWFQNAKLGLFLHWGLYSHTAGEWKGHPATGGEHFMLYERIPLKEYALIANDFNPQDFNAEAWVRMAREAGMKYVVITSKHHDGFAMYNSVCSDYNIVKRTLFGRDPMIELAEACRRQGLKFGFYYSLGRDWEDPDVPTNWPTKGGRSNTWDYPDEDSKNLQAYIDRKVVPQLKELLTQYGKIDFLWFDTPELVTEKQSTELRKLIHSLQKECLINSRIGNGCGDYLIIEQKLADKTSTQPWEACLTMGKNWSYNRYDTVYKKPDVIVRHLTDIVSKGGNLLLNIGPDGKGNFPRLAQERLEYLHAWMTRYGEAVYGTRPWYIFGENLDSDLVESISNKEFHDAVYDGTPQDIIPDFRYTCRGQNVYVFVRHVSDLSYTLQAFQQKEEVAEVTCLGERNSVKWKMTQDGLHIEMQESSKRFPIYVLKVTLKH